MTTRSVHRICAFCGREGITLHIGGYGGTLYKCPNCQYVGPIVLEGTETEDEDTVNENQNQPVEFSDPISTSTNVESEKYLASLWKASNTLNKTGFFFGLIFMAVGAVLSLFTQPPPTNPPSRCIGCIGQDSWIIIFAIGAFLTIVSGLFFLVDKRKQTNGSQSAQ